MPRLAETIGQKLATGVLPARGPVEVRLGYGHGQPCSACEQRILHSQPEYEVADRTGFTVRFHLVCFGLWEAECQRRGRPSPSADRPPKTISA